MTIQNGSAPAAANGRGARNGGERFHVDHASAEPLLQRLDGVLKSGNGWRARCPACGGRSRKLSVAERDGRVLVHCFSCADSNAVLAAVGLAWADLHPPRHWPASPEQRRQARQAIREAGWASALSVLSLEAAVVMIAVGKVLHDEPLDWDDYCRLVKAEERIGNARTVLVEDRR